MLDKVDKRDAIKHIKDAEIAILVGTEKGVGIVGEETMVFAVYANLTRYMLENDLLSEKQLDRLIEIAKMDDKQIKDEALNLAQEIINKIKNNSEE